MCKRARDPLTWLLAAVALYAAIFAYGGYIVFFWRLGMPLLF